MRDCLLLRRVVRRSVLLTAFSIAMSGAASADGLIDPTQPPRAATGKQPVAGEPSVVRPVLRLQGIWHRVGGRVAVVNGMRVRPGDSVEGQRVLQVLHDSVQMRSSDGLANTLYLLPQVRRSASELLPPGDSELAVRH